MSNLRAKKIITVISIVVLGSKAGRAQFDFLLGKPFSAPCEVNDDRRPNCQYHAHNVCEHSVLYHTRCSAIATDVSDRLKFPTECGSSQVPHPYCGSSAMVGRLEQGVGPESRD